MSRNTSVSLGEHFTDFIDDAVASGRYSGASDVIRAGLRLLADHEARMAALRIAISEGTITRDALPAELLVALGEEQEN